MPFDIKKALSTEFPKVDFAWDQDRIILYHLGLGAGADFTNEKELEYTYEKSLKVLPTFAAIPVYDTAGFGVRAPGVDVNPHSVVHGEHEILLNSPIPVEGKVYTESQMTGIWDRGSGAIIEITNTTKDVAGGQTYFTNIWSLFVRGEGEFGGEAGPKNDVILPDRKPDQKLELPILLQQSQIYRLSGDKALLHIDPEQANLAGFDKPIGHGLCSMGMVCKAMVDGMLGGDVARVARYRGRFAKPVYPGETMVVSMWEDGNRIVAHAETKERNTPVLTNAIMEIRS